LTGIGKSRREVYTIAPNDGNWKSGFRNTYIAGRQRPHCQTMVRLSCYLRARLANESNGSWFGLEFVPGNSVKNTYTLATAAKSLV